MTPTTCTIPRTRLIAVENTHNRCGGVPLTVEYMHDLGKLAREHGLRVHLDGARIFNAAVALGVDVKALVADADTVTFCLSKGLAAPVGSVVCGERPFIREARRARKVVGGGMRQAGVIAAAGIVALEQMVDRLAEDHENARALAARAGRDAWHHRWRRCRCAPTSSTSASPDRTWMPRNWWLRLEEPACGCCRWTRAGCGRCRTTTSRRHIQVVLAPSETAYVRWIVSRFCASRLLTRPKDPAHATPEGVWKGCSNLR